MDSSKEAAPTGRIMNSCIASLFPAWEPPLMTLKLGTGSCRSLLPARSAMWRYSATPLAPAPALHTAMETARMAFAPSLDLHQPQSFWVPSSSWTMRSSRAFCAVGSLPSSAGPMTVLMFATAFLTPLPMYSAPPSRSSRAS